MDEQLPPFPNKCHWKKAGRIAVSIRLTDARYAALKEQCNKDQTNPTTVITAWVNERIDAMKK